MGWMWFCRWIENGWTKIYFEVIDQDNFVITYLNLDARSRQLVDTIQSHNSFKHLSSGVVWFRELHMKGVRTAESIAHIGQIIEVLKLSKVPRRGELCRMK